MLKHISEKNRIDTFEQAAENIAAKKFSIFERFDKLDWEFFNIQAARNVKPDILIIPFERDFNKLTP